MVVANAGFGVVGDVAGLTLEDYRRQFETNVFGVLRTVWASLDDIKRARGRVVIIGSVSGHVVTPGSSPFDQQYTTEELRAAVEIAHAACIPVTVHAHASTGIKAAVDAGLKEAAAVGVNGTPTLYVNGYRVVNIYDPAATLQLIRYVLGQ